MVHIRRQKRGASLREGGGIRGEDEDDGRSPRKVQFLLTAAPPPSGGDTVFSGFAGVVTALNLLLPDGSPRRLRRHPPPGRGRPGIGAVYERQKSGADRGLGPFKGHLSLCTEGAFRRRWSGFEAVLWFVYGAGSEAPPSGREVDGLSFEVQH